jgi:hypothetical protein
MKRLRWQHWVLIGVFSSIGYLFVIVIIFALTADG